MLQVSARFEDAYNALLRAQATTQGALTGRFITTQQWESLHTRRGSIQDEWISSKREVFQEVEPFILSAIPVNDKDFVQFIERQGPTIIIRILLTVSSMPLQMRIPKDGVLVKYRMHIIDGTFSTAPTWDIQVRTGWNYALFTYDICLRLEKNHQGFSSLGLSLGSSHAVNRGDLRIFIVDKSLSISIITAISILCDTSIYSEEILSTILPEIIWGGFARNFPLVDMIPTPDLCDILIIPGLSYRRRWYSPTSYLSDYLQYLIYRECMPWYTLQRAQNLSGYIHIHTMPYYGSINYIDATLPSLAVEISQAVIQLWQEADLNTRTMIIQSNSLWGNPLMIDKS
jgi:hypothetical protein